MPLLLSCCSFRLPLTHCVPCRRCCTDLLLPLPGRWISSLTNHHQTLKLDLPIRYFARHQSNPIRTASKMWSGEPNTACVAYARQAWGVSLSQGYRLIKRAWRQIHDDFEGPDLDRQEMLAWCVQTLI